MYLQLNVEPEPVGVFAAPPVSTYEKHKHHWVPLPNHLEHLP
ncbi:hypothetical protein [Microbulbifer marinus]|nr:hypothetical protein [Microbulbifer marinus]